jgi:hypothetical protein
MGDGEFARPHLAGIPADTLSTDQASMCSDLLGLILERGEAQAQRRVYVS